MLPLHFWSGQNRSAAEFMEGNLGRRWGKIKRNLCKLESMSQGFFKSNAGCYLSGRAEGCTLTNAHTYRHTQTKLKFLFDLTNVVWQRCL